MFAAVPNPVLAVLFAVPKPPKPPEVVDVFPPNALPPVEAGAPNPVAGFAAPKVVFDAPKPPEPKPPVLAVVLFAPPKIEVGLEALLLVPKPVFPDPNPAPPLPNPVEELLLPKKPDMAVFL